MTTILFFSDDLMFSSNIASAARRLGGEMQSVIAADTLLSRVANAEDCIVLLDLTCRAVDPADLVPKLKSLAAPPKAIVAFGPHVHEGRLAAAQAAGCDLVVSRGQFTSQIDQILARWL